MVKAILRNRTIQPIEPLPPKWHDGVELIVEEAEAAATAEAIRAWNEEAERRGALIDPQDFERVESALAEADQRARG
jgi:hypothetical protein